MEEWQARRDDVRPEGEVPEWYRRIADVDEPAQVVVTAILAQEAERQQPNGCQLFFISPLKRPAWELPVAVFLSIVGAPGWSTDLRRAPHYC